jgi:hypothetical protein
MGFRREFKVIEFVKPGAAEKVEGQAGAEGQAAWRDCQKMALFGKVL